MHIFGDEENPVSEMADLGGGLVVSLHIWPTM